MYIEEKIGEEYKVWKGGDSIFIGSQTGTGKTHFILKKYLPYVASLGMNILYFVNRSILKIQLEEVLYNNIDLPQNSIKIVTYQHLEQLLFENAINLIEKLSENDIFVCDEAHYFLADSTFNTYSDLSYSWIKDKMENKICIFLSATISDARRLFCSKETRNPYIEAKRYQKYQNDLNITCKSIIENAEKGLNRQSELITEKQCYEYKLEREYRNLYLDIIEKREQVAALVTKDIKNKWLIFVDSISYGKELEREIKVRLKNLTENESCDKEKYDDSWVRLLSAKYYNSAGATRERDIISKEERQNAKVLIATSVMDNGISLKDCKLKNVVIIADTEVEFIQMLGRKRREISEEVKLYIYKYNKEYFAKRKKEYIDIYNFSREVDGEIEKSKQEYITNKQNDGQINCDDWDKFVAKQVHHWLLNKFFRENVDFILAKKLLYLKDGLLHKSELATQHVFDLTMYYEHIYDLFEREDEYAFVKEQLSWLGMKREDIVKQIAQWKQGKEENSIKKIVDKLRNICGKILSKDENLKIKIELYEDFYSLIDAITDEQWENLPENLKKDNDKSYLINWIKKYKGIHPITDRQMGILNHIYSIPYTIKHGNEKGEYIFVEKEV